MRHLVPIAVFASCLALAVGALDHLGRQSDQAGLVLVIARGGALAALPASQDLRVLDAWMGGRVLQLHADSLARVRLPEHAVLAVVRLPLQALALPACG